ncbi:hypothetical protein SR65_14055 [Enterobacter roggenkampii]|nr:hypothetical protein SR65_14055 [Enterobacter roggenkampii]
MAQLEKLYKIAIENEEKLSESEARCAALAAENAGLKESVEHAAGCIAAAEAEGLIDSLDEKDGERLADLIHRRLCHAYLPVKTPATDAFLAEVRAQGVEMMAAEADQLMDEFGDDSYKVMVTADLQRFANAFAAQIRKGEQP